MMIFQNFSIHYRLEKGTPAKKLIMGAPLYGQSFSLAERSQSGLNAPTYGGGEAGEATRARGFLSYYEVRFYFLSCPVISPPAPSPLFVDISIISILF